MYFQRILLDLFSKLQGERSLMAPYYILRGKKSGQTLQDIHYYQATHYFGIAPDLTKESYLQAIEGIFIEKWLQSEAELVLTEKGLEQLENFSAPGYDYSTNTVLLEFEKRLLLLVQVASNRLANNTSYYPIVQDEMVQRQCKSIIHHCGGIDQASYLLKKELSSFLEHEDISNDEKTLFVYRLTGHTTAGLTWNQLEEYLSIQPLDALFIYRSVLSKLATYWRRLHSPLIELLPPSETLTETARKTLELYNQGHTFDRIAAIRHLKESTIEDHFVEIAVARPDISFEEILTGHQIEEILHIQKQLNTHKLKRLREDLPGYSYFQLRLALAKGGVTS